MLEYTYYDQHVSVSTAWRFVSPRVVVIYRDRWSDSGRVTSHAQRSRREIYRVHGKTSHKNAYTSEILSTVSRARTYYIIFTYIDVGHRRGRPNATDSATCVRIQCVHYNNIICAYLRQRWFARIYHGEHLFFIFLTFTRITREHLIIYIYIQGEPLRVFSFSLVVWQSRRDPAVIG